MPVSESGAPRAAGFRLVLAGVLVVASLAGLVALIVLALGRTGGHADVQRDREASMNQASQFLLRLNTYGPDLLDSKGQMPDYRARVHEVITTKFATSFDANVTIAEQLVKQGGVERGAKVWATGVSSIDPDSATVIVAGQISQSVKVKGEDKPTDQARPFRIEVTLVKVDGTWLVDNYVPVSQESAR